MKKPVKMSYESGKKCKKLTEWEDKETKKEDEMVKDGI